MTEDVFARFVPTGWSVGSTTHFRPDGSTAKYGGVGGTFTRGENVNQIFHEFIIVKGVEKHSAYLLHRSSMVSTPDGMAYAGEGTGEFSAWTTLAAAKKHACTSIGRLRMSWDEIPDVDAIRWVAEHAEQSTRPAADGGQS